MNINFGELPTMSTSNMGEWRRERKGKSQMMATKNIKMHTGEQNLA